MDDNNKNLILATALSFLVILVWFLLFPPEEQAPIGADVPVSQAPVAADGVTSIPPPTPGAPENAAAPGAEAAPAPEAPRVAIETPQLSGSINLSGGRIDDLKLREYRETLDEESDIVRLLSPVGGLGAYYALFGWTPGGALDFDAVPGPATPWQVASGETLAPGSPVTLVWDNGAGLTFRREVAVDEDFMFTVTQSVENATDAAVRVAPYGLLARHGEPDSRNFFILHEGVVRMTDGELEEMSYDDMPDLDPDPREGGLTSALDVAGEGWIGFTDHYWMTTLVPEAGTPFASVAKYVPGRDVYQTEARLPAIDVAPGATGASTQRLFAGAKEWEAIRAYERGGIDGFLDSIDWGWFFFLTKPIFAVLHWLNALIGNMGIAIITLTLLIKAVLLPLAYKSYVSMAKMKELQPEMEKIKERAGDDRQKLQQEMMKMYKEKKVNPASGCLSAPVADPHLLLPLQGDLRHDRAAPCAFLRPVPGPVSAGSDVDLQRLRAPALGRAGAGKHPGADLHRHPAAAARHLDVAPAEAEPRAPGPDAGDDLRLDALGVHVHARQLRVGSRRLLDREQYDHLRPAVRHHEEPGDDAGPLRQHQGIVQEGPGGGQRREGAEGQEVRLAAIHRHPVKALGFEELERTVLTAGETLPWDRRWAVAHERAKPDGGNWVPCANFSRGASSPALMAVTARYDEGTGRLALRHPERPDLTVDPDAEGDALVDWARPLVAEGRPAPAALVRAAHSGMTDADRPWVSLHTDASRAALAEAAGLPLSRHRFRGNLWIDGAEAWAENGWIGREIRIGDAALEVIEPIWRCRATEANPETGRRDADTMGAMRSLVGDTTFGVYAEVVSGAEIALGDPVAA